ncbi:MAG: DUF1559 domain-containing protein, partial [Planctomycetaceae bacterium]|nr:DUF1559 domain-containing protein [Planctomycetaceae bacterium]
WEETAAYAALVKSGLWDAAGDDLRDERMDGTGGVSVSVTATQGEKAPEPSVVIVLHGGAKLMKDVSTLMAAAGATGETATICRFIVLRGRVEGTPPMEWALWDAGEHLVLAVGSNTVERANRLLDGAQPDITQARLWADARTAPKNVTLNAVGWLDVQQFRTSVGTVSLADPQSPFKTVDDFLEVVGLGGLHEILIQQGYEGRNCWSHSVLNATGPRTGVMELFNGKPFRLTNLPPIPEKSSCLYAWSLDLVKLYDAGWKLVRDISARLPDGAMEVAKMEAAVAKFEGDFGLKIRDDVLAGLGSLHVLYGDTSNAFGGIGVGVIVQVNDAAKVRKVLDLLVPLVPNNPNGPKLTRSQKLGREFLSFGQPGLPFWPTACVEEKWLIVGLTPQVVESCLLRLDGKLAAWKPDADVQAGLAGWPQEYLSLSVNDPRAFVIGITQTAPMILAGVQMARQQQGQTAPLPNIDFPAAELIAQPLFPNVSVCAIENGQIVWRSRQSVPGLPLIGGLDGPSVGTSAILVALLLPAVQQARIAARRTQSRNNIKQIALSLHNFADQHGQLPAGTVVGSAEKPEDRLSWMSQMLPFLDQQALAQRVDAKRGWNQGANQTVGQNALVHFLNPQSPLPPMVKNQARTDYVGVAGLGVNGPLTKPGDKGAGVFAYDHPRKFRDVTDGTSNTLMTGEVSQNLGPWMQGGPATIRPFTQKPYLGGPDGYGGVYPGGAHFGLGDGSVRFFSDKIDPALMEALTTIQGGERVGEF